MTNLRFARQLADFAEPLDDVSDPVQEAVQSVPQPVRDILDGVWFGNPLHPALTDVPLGAWSAAFALDLVGSDAADAALAVGVLGAVPAALTGLNDWSHVKDDARRIGTVHALVNTAGLTLNVLSLAARRGGMREVGRLLSMAAYGGALFSAHLGGHLTFGLGVRVNRTAFESPRDRYAPSARSPSSTAASSSASSSKASRSSCHVPRRPARSARSPRSAPTSAARSTREIGMATP